MEKDNNVVKYSRIRWLYLAMGAIALLLGGIVYAWSILKAPLAQEFGWSEPQLALNYTIMMCMFVLGGFISGLISKSLSPRVRLFGAAILALVGFFLAARVSEDSIWLLYIAYGACAGIGMGVLYNVAISVIGGWFPDLKGLSSGILLMCFGFSTLITGRIVGSLINLPSVGWRTTYLVLGIAIAAISLILAVVLKEAPVSESSKHVYDDTDKDVSSDIMVESTATQMIRRASFWKLMLFFILLAAIGNCVISFAKDFAIFAGASEGFAITVVGLLSVCNGISRVVCGILYDRLELKTTQYIISCVAILAPVCGIIALVTDVHFLQIITLPLCGFAYGLCPTSTALYPRVFYGESSYAVNYGIMNLHAVPASMTATLAGVIIAKTESYLPVFIMLTGFGVLASILLVTTRKA